LGTFDFQSGTIRLGGDRNLATDVLVAEFFGAGPTIAVGKILDVDGLATIQAGSTVTMSGGTLSAETVLMTPGSRVTSTQSSTMNGAILALAGSLFDVTVGNLVLGDATKVNGFGMQGTLSVGANTVTLLDANDVVFDSLSLTTLGSGANSGTVSAANGLTLDFGGNITGFGTITTPNNVAKPLINNGHITGTSGAQRITLPGYVKGVGTFDNVNLTGTFSPGLSPTILTVGNLGFSSTSLLLMELGGTAPGSGYDQILSSGALGLDGALQLALINGFSPMAGQSFNLFDWTSLSGTFDTLSLPALGAGLSWNTSQLYNTGVLTVVSSGIPGDFDLDGDVDGRDFLVWQRNPSVGNLGDWQTNYGASGLSASVAVPEPSAFVLALLGICSLGRKQLSIRRG
jgi:hypothetical protein